MRSLSAWSFVRAWSETMALSEQIAQFLATGITEGCVYALVALGFTIIFNAPASLQSRTGAM